MAGRSTNFNPVGRDDNLFQFVAVRHLSLNTRLYLQFTLLVSLKFQGNTAGFDSVQSCATGKIDLQSTGHQLDHALTRLAISHINIGDQVARIDLFEIALRPADCYGDL